MKKLLTVMMLATITTMTQAAQINWQSGNFELPTYFVSMADYDGTWNGTTTGSFTVTAYYFRLTATEHAALNLTSIAQGIEAGTYDYTTAPTAKVTASGLTTKAASWGDNKPYAASETGYILAIYILTGYQGTDWYIVDAPTFTVNPNGDAGTYQNIAKTIGVWTPIPEPATMALVGIGIVAFGLRRRRK